MRAPSIIAGLLLVSSAWAEGGGPDVVYRCEALATPAVTVARYSTIEWVRNGRTVDIYLVDGPYRMHVGGISLKALRASGLGGAELFYRHPGDFDGWRDMYLLQPKWLDFKAGIRDPGVFTLWGAVARLDGPRNYTIDYGEYRCE